MGIRAVATDVDGTLTLRRGDLRISYSAIRGIRALEASGVKVILVSGNSLPVTAGLAVYIGSSGPVVAENGCVVMYRGEVYHACEGRPSELLVRQLVNMGLRPSWQNAYRHHDIAFYVPRGLSREDVSRLLEEASRLASRENMKVLWSGYAVHINPGRGKSQGLMKALELIGVTPDEAAAIGDGENDLDMLSAVKVSGCPGDASEAVKKVVKFVASRRGGSGFLEFANWLLSLQKA